MGFAEKVRSFISKSLTGKGTNVKEKEEEDDDDDPEGYDGGDGDEGGDEGGDKGTEKSLVDATDILSSLVTELDDIKKSFKDMIIRQDDVGEAIVGVAEMVSKIANTPLPPKSTLAKSTPGGGEPGAGGGAFPRTEPNGIPTQEEFERAQAVLIKSYKDGEITLLKSEMISSDLQKAMRIPGYKMNPEYFNFLSGKMRA